MIGSPRSLVATILADRAELAVCQDGLSHLGYRNLERVVRDVRDLASHHGAELAAQLLGECGKSGDPDMALNNVERLIARHPTPIDFSAVLLRSPRLRNAAAVLGGASQPFADLLVRQPALLGWVVSRPLRKGRQTLIEELRQEIDAARDTDERWDVLRRFKARESLRIGYHDLVAEASVADLIGEISDLADSVIQVALEVAGRDLERSGRFDDLSGGWDELCVLGMGKLGGQELNYSSDIDLILLYRDEGPGGALRRQDYFHRLSERLVQSMSRATDWGSAYRVDLRLRPEGGTGTIARTLRATLEYYQTLGRPWERQALIKARPVAGDLRLGGRFLRKVAPFIYGSLLTVDHINHLKELKATSERQALGVGEGEDEVKSGPGGIRDIEAIVQLLQLLHGRDDPHLRHPATLEALDRLRGAGILTSSEHRTLRTAYLFLRQVEHRLQLLHDLQTHRLPRLPEERVALARRLGYTGDAEQSRGSLEQDLDAHRNAVRRVFDQVYQDRLTADGPAAAVVDQLRRPQPDLEQLAQSLTPFGFQNASSAASNLLALLRPASRFLKTSPRTLDLLSTLLPHLLEAAARAPDPDRSLNNLERFVARYGSKDVLFQLLIEKPAIRQVLIDLSAHSQFLSELLSARPELLDPLMDALATEDPGWEARRDALEQRLIAGESPDAALADLRALELLRIGVRDIQANANTAQTLGDLSALADCIVQCVYAQTESQREAPLVVVAYGKLGGSEINYASDLDLMFVGEGDSATARAQKIIRRLRGGEAARLYDVDLDLRPEGRRGDLVPSLASLRRYFLEGRAALWEVQALTRARVITGDRELALQVESFCFEVLTSFEWRPEHAAEIESMRARIAEQSGPEDLKRGEGGVLDVEFAVQTLQLRHASTDPRILRRNTLAGLRIARQLGFLAPRQHEALLAAYGFLRKLENRLQIVYNLSLSRLPDEAREREMLARRLGYVATRHSSAAQTMGEELAYHRRLARAAFEAVLKSVSA